MPLYEYACAACGSCFDRLAPIGEAAELAMCPSCGGEEARRVPSIFAPFGRADPGPGRSAWPRTWEQVGHGDRETIARWQRTVASRLELERRNPELAPPPQPAVASHEHPHGHGHPHANGHDTGAAPKASPSSGADPGS